MGRRVSAGEEETVERRIAWPSHVHRRTAAGGKQRSSASWGSGGSVAQGGK
jgi:hypothetical protein